MLISQSQSEPHAEQGSSDVDFAELRRRIADTSRMCEAHRQRLVDLARRLARVRALGGEYSRVDFSDAARHAMTHPAGA